MKRSIHTAMFLALILGGCKRDDLNLDALTTNPFDADYNGPAIFSKVGERTVPYTLGGITYHRLELDVRVNTGLLPAGAGYGVSYRAPGVSAAVVVPAAELVDDLFTLNILQVTSGQNYCAEVKLTNNGGSGGGNALCGTAE